MQWITKNIYLIYSNNHWFCILHRQCHHRVLISCNIVGGNLNETEFMIFNFFLGKSRLVQFHSYSVNRVINNLFYNSCKCTIFYQILYNMYFTFLFLNLQTELSIDNPLAVRCARARRIFTLLYKNHWPICHHRLSSTNQVRMVPLSQHFQPDFMFSRG